MFQWVKEETKFSFVFVLCIASIVVPSLFNHDEIYEWVFMISFTVLTLAGAFTIRATEKHTRFVLAWAAITIFFSWLLFFDVSLVLPDRLGNLPFFAFFAYMVYRMIRSMLLAKNITPDLIFGAITGYIFLGYTGAIYFNLIHDLYPGSFGGAITSNTMNSVYFSFITMSTLGYGDIHPISNAAKGASIILTILGQFYIAVVVAVMVSKYIANGSKSD